MALQAGTILEFGINTPLKSYGLYQNHTLTKQTERATARGEGGATVSTKEFDPTYTLSLNYMKLTTQDSTPVIGVKFTLLNLEWQIDSVADGNTIDGFATTDISATSYPSAAIAGTA